MFLAFIIHPCDPTVVIYYLIRPCDIAVRITYLISHSYSLSYNTGLKDISGCVYGCIINTKLPSSVDIIPRTSLGFPSWCLESTRPTDSCFQGTSCENLMMYGGLYQHTQVVLYMYSLVLVYLGLLSTSYKQSKTHGKQSKLLTLLVRSKTLVLFST